MKKFLIFTLLCLLPLGMRAQKIKKSEYDKFNKSKHIETSWVNVRKNVVDLNDVHVRLYAFKGQNFLEFKINNFNTVIPEGSAITLLSENGDTCDFEVFETAFPGTGKGAVSIMGSAKPGVTVLSIGDLEFLEDNLITDIRINTSEGYVDYEIKKDNSQKLQKAYNLFKKELDK